MHGGCSGSFEDGKAVVDKVRGMGFDQQQPPAPLFFTCSCGVEQEMLHFVHTCTSCTMVHGVTPCHAFDPVHIMEAGKEY